MYRYINKHIYMYILLVTLLGITSVASGYMIGLFMFCFCLNFCKAVQATQVNFTYLFPGRILHRPLHETIGT